MFTKEQQFGVLVFNVACVDGKLDDTEINRIVAVANANDLNSRAVIEAVKNQLEDATRLDVVAVAKSVAEEDKDLMMFGCIRVAFADGIVAIKELQRIHTICDLIEYGPQYVTITLLRMLKKDPSIKIEGVDA